MNKIEQIEQIEQIQYILYKPIYIIRKRHGYG